MSDFFFIMKRYGGCLFSIIILIVCCVGSIACINSCSREQSKNYVDNVKVLVVKKNFLEGRKGRIYYDVVFKTEHGMIFSQPVSREMYNIYEEGEYYYIDDVRKKYIGEEENDNCDKYFKLIFTFLLGIIIIGILWFWKLEDETYEQE